MKTTRQRLAALTLCLLALASVTVAIAPAAGQTAGNDDGASNVTELDASFEYDSVDGCNPHVEGEWNSLTLTANAEAYAVTFHADGLDAEELVNIFDDGLDAAEPDISAVERVDDETVRLRVRSRNATLPANFSNVDTGDYEFVFEAGENATATATVTKAEVSCVRAEFLRGGSYESGRSGVVTVPIWLDETDEARVSITGSDLSLSADIVDGNDDGIVTLDLNTHLVGRDAPDDGHGRSYWTRQGLTVRDSADSIGDIALDDVPGGDDPLPTGEYELAVDRERIDYTLATAPLSITDTAAADFESWMGPADTLANATAGDLRRAIANGTLVDNESVSNGSALVYEIQSASVFGPLEAAVSQYDGSDRYAQAFFDIAADRELSTVPGNPVTFDIAADSGARIDLRETYRNDGLVFAPDRDNRTLYVGLRTDRLTVRNGTAVGSGQEFEANLTINGEISRQPVTFRGVNATLALPSTPQTPVAPTPDDTATERDRAPTPDTPGSTTVGGATVETPTSATVDSTGESPDATTAVTGPGFGVAGVLFAVLALSGLAAGRNRD
ncbi:hypothetical protein SAMN05216388_103228 [Halorientalis persicus]|uniref:Uncharacterized protein n=1 Tax=Halorientalis persicus TaxID=1367881 RepID=A0A1H8V151_9EURY|nr:hypothetical protein [Halorientalis persicus]SEP09121.1 hypothetical protein SAMN05216388_103228 [Halorientalis persicus]